MKNFQEGELNIAFISESGKKVVRWTGKSKERNPYAIIQPYLKDVLSELKESDNLVVDFTPLLFMNSSTVTIIVEFVRNLESDKISTEIQYNKSLEWQVASFKALETITMSMKNIKIAGV